MKKIAVIPVKEKSERVESKNFREFYKGKSLFDLLIEKLIHSKTFDKIYVSSNSHSLKQKVNSLGIEFISRDDSFCNNDIPWSDVIAHVAESIPEKDDSILAWCHTTSPLFTEYEKAMKEFDSVYKEGTNDGLVTVSKVNDFIISENLQPLNYSWGPWHRYSQHLDNYFSITGALFIAPIKEMILNRYVISKNPFLYEVSPIESIDIDTQLDFEIAKMLMKNRPSLIKNA
tara:strand:+ start:606 stop:1295 length:690 start_codon:yes stop_codon:yes gene_type:complete